MLDEMFQQNASKFVILTQTRGEGIHFYEFKVARNENEKKNYLGFIDSKDMANFEAV